MNVPSEFARQMVIMAEAYGVELTEQRIRIYYAELRDIPMDALKVAMSSARRESKFFPSIAEIRQQAVPGVEEGALIAWSGLERAAAQVGSFRPLIFEDQAAAFAVLDVFGSWAGYCEQERLALAAKKAEFIAVYRQRRREIRQLQSPTEPCILPGALGSGTKGDVGRLRLTGNVTLGSDKESLLGDGHERLALREAGEPESRQTEKASEGNRD